MFFFRKYLWWRHSHGFGVHSPWVYGLVKDAFRSSGRYYAYDNINRAFGNRARLARVVFRTLLYLRPQRVEVVGNHLWKTLAQEAIGTGVGGSGKTVIVDNPAQFHSMLDADALIFTCLDTKAGRCAWNRVLEANRGKALTVVDTHRRLGVIVRRRGLPAQTVHMRTLLPSQ